MIQVCPAQHIGPNPIWGTENKNGEINPKESPFVKTDYISVFTKRIIQACPGKEKENLNTHFPYSNPLKRFRPNYPTEIGMKKHNPEDTDPIYFCPVI
jgi:hypothetical protein